MLPFKNSLQCFTSHLNNGHLALMQVVVFCISMGGSASEGGECSAAAVLRISKKNFPAWIFMLLSLCAIVNIRTYPNPITHFLHEAELLNGNTVTTSTWNLRSKSPVHN